MADALGWNHMSSDSLIPFVIVVGLLAVYAILFFGTLDQGGSPCLAGLLATVGIVAYIGVVLHALRDWWEG